MRQQLETRTHTAFYLQKILVTSGVVASFVCLAFLITWARFPTTKRLFVFTGNEDRQWTNAGNWQPSYPGNEIAKGMQVMVYGPVEFENFDLTVSGELDIEMGGNLKSTSKAMIIAEGARVENRGAIEVAHISNNGTLVNQVSASLSVDTFLSSIASLTTNQPAAKINTAHVWVNNGIMRNYSQIYIGQTFINGAVYEGSAGASVWVDGKLNN